MTTATLQTIFDDTVRHLIKQGKPAYKDGTCWYRMQDVNGTTLKCAAGFHIPDDKYDPEMETKVIGDSRVYSGLPPEMREGENLGLVCHLQTIHDAPIHRGSFNWSVLKKDLQDLADYFPTLNLDVLNELPQ